MRNRGLNPEVYPVGEVNDFHLGTAMMGFGNLTHADGYLDDLTASYAYAPSPECSASQPDCGTKYLSCDVTRARCLPIVPSNPPNNPVGPLPQPCPAPKPQGYQNSFCMDGTCDMSKWVWIPVKIVSKRPPEFKRYHSYPVMNGAISRTSDIYEPSSYMDASRYSWKTFVRQVQNLERFCLTWHRKIGPDNVFEVRFSLIQILKISF